MTSYVLQLDEKSTCPKCGKYVELLCPRYSMNKNQKMFYICFDCRKIYKVGEGEVPRE